MTVSIELQHLLDLYVAIKRVEGQGEFDAVKAELEAVRTAVVAKLPTKEDGTAFTDEEIHALAQQVRDTAQQTLDRG